MSTPSNGKGKERALEQFNSMTDLGSLFTDMAALEDNFNRFGVEMGELMGTPNTDACKEYVKKRVKALFDTQQKCQNDVRLNTGDLPPVKGEADLFAMFEKRLHDKANFASMISTKGLLKVEPGDFAIEYPWGKQIMKHRIYPVSLTTQQSDLIRTRLEVATNFAMFGHVPRDRIESVKRSCQKLYEELGDNYPATDIDKHPEIVGFENATSCGLVIHGCQVVYDGYTSVVSAFMHRYLQMQGKAENNRSIVLVHSVPTFLDSQSKRDPTNRIAIMKSLCVQLLRSPGFSSFSFVTNAYLVEVEKKNGDFNVLCQLFRNLIIDAAGSMTSRRKVTVLVDGVHLMDNLECKLNEVLWFFRALCDELEFTGLILNMDFNYILLHPGISSVAADPHPTEFHAFLDSQLGQERIDELERRVVRYHTKGKSVALNTLQTAQMPLQQNMPAMAYGPPYFQPQNTAGVQGYLQPYGGQFGGIYYPQLWPQPLPGTMPQQQIFVPPAYGLQSHQPQKLGGPLQIGPYAWQAPTAFTAGMQPPPPYFIPQYPSGGQQGGGQGGFGQGQHFKQRSSRGSGANQRGQK